MFTAQSERALQKNLARTTLPVVEHQADDAELSTEASDDHIRRLLPSDLRQKKGS
jgi:hypothetical protein